MTALRVLYSFLAIFGLLLSVTGAIAGNYAMSGAGLWMLGAGAGVSVLYYFIDLHLYNKEIARQRRVAAREAKSRMILEQEGSLLTYNPYHIVRIAERKAEEAFRAHDARTSDSDYFISRLNYQLDERAMYETEPR